MRVVLIGTEFEENLSVRCLAAAALRAGHQVDILHYSEEGDLPAVVQAVTEGSPDFVGLSIAFQHHARDFIKLACELRRTGFRGHLCAGGHVPTAAWSHLLADVPALDTVVRHDGELTLLELLGVLGSPERWLEVEGVCARGADGAPTAAPARRQPDDLDALPFPLRDRPHTVHAGLKFAPLVGSRGCFGNCNYCCINAWHKTAKGKRFRLRSPASVADEMSYLFHDRDVRIFCFHDDTFYLARERDTVARLEQLRVELQRRRLGRIALVGKCRPDQVTPAVLKASLDCGVARMYLGVENGSEAGLRNLNRHHDLASCRRALELFREARMFACFNILLFEPDSQLRDLRDNVRFLEQNVEFPFNFCRAEVYCGSNYERRLLAERRLEGNYLGYSYQIAEPRVELAFRISAVAFRSRNFAADGVANFNTGMGYEAALLRHFYAPAGEPLAREVEALTEEVGRDTVKHLSRLVEFAASADLADDRGAADFTEELATEINFRDLELHRRQCELRAEVERFGEQHGDAALDGPDNLTAMQGGA
jgi:anaerobic magnesium-protoporphyrin IX monomethyl ester cyclase